MSRCHHCHIDEETRKEVVPEGGKVCKPCIEASESGTGTTYVQYLTGETQDLTCHYLSRLPVFRIGSGSRLGFPT